MPSTGRNEDDARQVVEAVSLRLTGAVPAVCDAEAGQQHSSRSELVKANPARAAGPSSTAFPQATRTS